MKHLKNIILAFFMSLVLFSSSMATVSSEDTPRVQYTANGITTNFPITFAYASISDVHVYFISNSTGLATAWTKDAAGPTGYTVSAGSIIANTAPSNGYLVAVCETPITQLVDVKPNRALPADTLEGVFDKLTLIGRDLKGKSSRSLVYGPTYTGSIPYAEDLADEIQQDSVNAAVAAVSSLSFSTSLHIDNIEALRLYAGGETTSIYLDGHTSIGDGGHGPFRWDATSTAADDNGVTIAVTGVATGRWIRQLNGFVTPEMFGSKGNGVDDDGPAIRSCAALGRVGLTPGKTYLIDSPESASNTTADSLVTIKPNGGVFALPGHGAKPRIVVGDGVLGLRDVFAWDNTNIVPHGELIFRDFYCDLNGQNNLRTSSGEPSRNNALIEIAMHNRIFIENVEAENAPGNQVFWVHDPDTSNGPTLAVTRHNRIKQVGASIPGNHNGDHSSSYIQATYVVQEFNTFENDAMATPTANTAMELHGEHLYCLNNKIKNYNRSTHIVAGESGLDCEYVKYSGNVNENVRLGGAAFWSTNSKNFKFAIVNDSVFDTAETLSAACCMIDTDTYMGTGVIKKLGIRGNKWTKTMSTYPTIPCLISEKVEECEVVDNHFEESRYMAIESKATKSMVIDRNTFVDCATAGDEVLKIAGAAKVGRFTNNNVKNVSGNYSENAVLITEAIDDYQQHGNTYLNFFNDYPWAFTGNGLNTKSAIIKEDLWLDSAVPVPDADNYATRGSILTNTNTGVIYVRNTAGFGNTWKTFTF